MLARTVPRLPTLLTRSITPSSRYFSSPSSDLSGLTEEQAELRTLVHDFAQKEVAPLAASTDKNNLFPAHLWEKFGEMGLLGITAEEEYGGLGKSYLEHTIVSFIYFIYFQE